MRTVTACLVLLLAPAMAAAQDLTIYTYDSFTADWGPGPQVEKAFEAECGCDLRFIAVADGAALINRLRIEGADSDSDIVLGFDRSLMAEARQSGLFAPHGIAAGNIDLPGGWNDDTFLPYDYGYFAVVYDSVRLPQPPQSMQELVEGKADAKIVIQDPRTSSPGLGLLLWMRAVFGDEAPAAWEKLKDKVLTVTPGWSEAYGLFTGGEAEMVLSYTTSPAYHLKEEGEDRYRAALFEEGHYLQVELAGLTRRGADNPQARAFLAFMTGPGFQDAIPLTNWMYPAGKTSAPLDPVFDQLVRPEKALQLPPEEIAANRRDWIEEWLQAMSR